MPGKRRILGRGWWGACLAAVLCAAPLAAAADAQPQRELLIGLIPEMNIFKQKARFQALGQHLSRKIGIPVRFSILSRYGNIVESFQTDKMDGAFFGSFTGALAIEKLGVVPLARPVNLDGSSTYHGYLFVRADSRIHKVEDMRGKRAALVDHATTAGYVFPLAWLRARGVRSLDGLFSEHYFTGSHDAAIHAVLEGKADVGAAKHSVYDRVRREDPRVDRDLRILAESPRVPSNGLCVRKELPADIQALLKRALLDLQGDPQGPEVLAQLGARGFIETRVEDYQPVIQMAREAGIDLKNYQYVNR